MTALDSIILGIIQGLTEFLPVSSSGHLVVFQDYLGSLEHDISFDVVVHLATLFALFLVFRKEFKETIIDFFETVSTKKRTPGSWGLLMVVLGTIPTAIIGLSFKDHFESLFSNMKAVAGCFAVTGAILLVTRLKKSIGNINHSKIDINSLIDIKPNQAFLIGIAQSLAITPGISRSGITIAAALLLGLKPNVAAVFSFFLAVPAILGAVVLQIGSMEYGTSYIIRLFLGFIAAFISGIVGLKLVLKFVQRESLFLFSPYLFLLSLFLFWRIL